MPEMLLVTLLVGNFVLNLIILIFVVVLLRKITAILPYIQQTFPPRETQTKAKNFTG